MKQATRTIDASLIEEISAYLAKSAAKQNVYKCIYSGGAKPKTAKEIASITGLTNVRVSQIATPMADHGYFEIVRKGNEVAYAKYRDLVPKRDRILAVAKNPAKLKSIQDAKAGKITISIRTQPIKDKAIRVDFITVDDIDNFQKVRNVSFAKANQIHPKQLKEKVFKYGLARILGETGEFQDWGGEKNDLYSVNCKIKGKRCRCAIALKGRATAPPLTIKKLGKNANQIPHLFESSAEVFIIQFEGQILEEVVQQMETYSVHKSKQTGSLIRYGIIGGDDSARLRLAYPSAFIEMEE